LYSYRWFVDARNIVILRIDSVLRRVSHFGLLMQGTSMGGEEIDVEPEGFFR
jgi:hypothetical protein